MRTSVASVVFILMATVTASAEEVYYQNDFETQCDVVYWASAAKVQVDEIGLSTESPAGGQRCARIAFHVVSGGGWCYFKIPLEVKLDPAKTYVVEAMVKYETTGGGRVGFGHSWQHMPPGQAEVQGNGASAGTCSEPRKWHHLVGKELGAAFRESSEMAGWTAACPGRFDALYVHTEGNREGDRVTVWLDDVKFRETNAEDQARLAKQRRPVDYTPPPYPAVEDACPWGCCGSLEGHAGRLGLPREAEAAVVARQWADFGYDTSLRPGGMVMAPGNPKPEDALGQFLDLNQSYGLRVLPSTYLTGFYDRKVPRDQCEAAITRVVTRYRNHPALLAWWMIDEPMANVDDCENQWVWGKQRFEALDRQHPALGAFCVADAVAMYSQYTQVSLIDCYPLLGRPDKPAGDAATVARWCELSWRRGGRRIWAVPQAFGELGNWRIPTRAELRLMCFQYLSRGASGFIPYYYSAAPAWLTGYGHNGLVDLYGAPTHMGAEMQALADTLMPLCPLLAPVRWQGEQALARVACEPGAGGKPVLDLSVLSGPQHDLIVVCNLDATTARQGALSLSPAPGRKLYDLRALKPVQIPAGSSVPVSLRAGDAAVLLWGNDKSFAAAQATIRSRRVQLTRRQLDGLTREAAANGIPPRLWDDAVTQSAALARRGDYAASLALLAQTQTRVAAALRDVPGRQPCQDRLDRAREALSRASRALEVWVLQRWPERERSGKVSQMRADEPHLGPYVDTLTELARCEHLLQYALLAGQAPAHEAAYADLEALATQAETGVAGFVTTQPPLTIAQDQLKRLTAAVADLK
ncbi:hypothetical protein LLH23_00200 [bacterium]|nr:hypothetical protein [bacterium]